MLQIGNSCIYYSTIENSCISDYIRYIIDIISYVITSNQLAINIILGDADINFNNNNRILTINYNIEHTLVLKGGRGIPTICQVGTIETLDHSSHYMVRLDSSDMYEICDIIIDYSIPNITNICSCSQYKHYTKKIIYIAPAIYDSYYVDTSNRNINVLTTFINVEESRRKLLLETMDSMCIRHTNVNNCFEKDALRLLLCQTKIIINIHQTEHHHTFEELRVLPALLCGIIVIAEDSPLKETIPYHKMIIWTSYQNIINTIKEVENNYDAYHSKLFNANNIAIFNTLQEHNINVLKAALQ